MTNISTETSTTVPVRSRVTVVCVECKRMKLKCDRRTPCSSCVKRDVVFRCQYSQPFVPASSAETVPVGSNCVECKRLKLRCDRKTPCTSCVKRGIPQCQYSHPSVLASALSATTLQSATRQLIEGFALLSTRYGPGTAQVCAECTRMNLQCDRRTPCGCCVNRDTVPQCQYFSTSQAVEGGISVQPSSDSMMEE